MGYTGTDSNEITREFLDSLLLEQRLIGSELPETTTGILGKKFATPIMNAAFSHLEGAHPGYPAQMAEGFHDAGALNWWGMSTDEEMERIYGTGADTVEIIKPYADEELIRQRIAFAVSHGAFAVGMDIDHAYGVNGAYDEVHGIGMEPKNTEQLKRYVSMASGKPFVVKGVLSVYDAQKCKEAGVSAIVVSHHHGIFPAAVPPLMILPDIREAVGERMEIYVDCGISSGLDAFKALALGADAVSVSRAIIDRTAGKGAEAVKQDVERLTGELRSIMGRCGFSRIADIDDSVIWRK